MNNNKTDSLLIMKPYAYENKEKKPGGAFYEALMEELCFHYDENEKYRKFCGNKKFNPHEFQGELADIPSVQVSVFKNLSAELVSVPKEQIKLTLQSSATSGVPSSVLVDKITSKRQAKAMVHVISDFIGNNRKPFLIMDVDPATGFHELLGARFAAVSGYLNFASKVGYFLKVNDEKKYYFDIKGIETYVQELREDEPAVVFGFTYILYSEIIAPLISRRLQFKLPKGSKVLHIGGWKKLEDSKISKEEFNQKAAELFDLETTDIIDVYGFTEQMGLNYPDCTCGCKHASIYSEVVVRDVITKEVLPIGKEGLLEFISPIPHSYPGNVVLTDDIGMIEEEKGTCGRAGTRFRILGRLKRAEVRGCGDILSTKLTFAEAVNYRKNDTLQSQYRVEYFSDMYSIIQLSPEESLKKITESLLDKLVWLRNQPIDALIGLISQVANKWSVTNSNLFNAKELQVKGLGFLAAWCKPEHLNTIVTEGLNGNRMYVDTFLPVSPDSVQYRKAASRGLVCHWLAGNVQVLGMFVLIESILTKNVNLLKLSSRDNGVFASLLSSFQGEVYTTHGGYTITGDDLLKTLAIVYFEHSEHQLGKYMSRSANVRVAWGGREAVTTVANYPARYDCENIIMGPKLSFAVVGNESLADEHKVQKLARRLAVDASVFDQTGCASVHNVFVERNGLITPEEFARYLAEGMKKVAVQIPKEHESAEQIAAIHSIRGIYDFKGTVYGDADTIWSVLYSDDCELCKPVYSRVVFVHPVDHISDTLQFINEDIQTIALAAEGEKAINYASCAAERGALRFPVCGRMLNFDSPWDGIYLTDRLVKWVTLGGPVV